MAVQEYEGVIINKLTLTKYKELKAAGQLVASQTYVIEDYLGEYTYVCNGSTDNVQIGNIVRAFLSGGTDYGTLKLKVVGTFGMTAPAGGSGTSAAPSYWFHLNVQSNRKAIIDFSNCSQITAVVDDGSYNVIFHSNNGMSIIGANVVASNTTTDTIIRVVNTNYGEVHFENCRFWINGYKNSMIATNGTYVNCRGSVSNVINNSYCFYPADAGLIRVIGGEYYCFTANKTSYKSGIVGLSYDDSVCIMYGVNAPTQSRSGYYQTHSIYQVNGMVCSTDLISELPLNVISGSSNIRGTIVKSKAGCM